MADVISEYRETRMKTLGPVLLYSQERLELSCTIPCSLPLIYLSKWDLRCTETCNKGSDRSLNERVSMLPHRQSRRTAWL